MTASTPLIVTFSIYLLATIAIGFYAWYSTRTFDDYILGGRSLGETGAEGAHGDARAADHGLAAADADVAGKV